MSEELEVLKESAKATQEIAKTTGKGLDAAQKVGGFISKMIGGTLEQGIGVWEDKLKYKRYVDQLNYIKKIEDKKRELGLGQHQIQNLSMKMGIPLLESASLEDNDYLQELWANLTINSIDKDSQFTLERSYISVLEQISELEAKILIKIYSSQIYEAGVIYNIETANLPISVTSSVETVDLLAAFEDVKKGKKTEPPAVREEPTENVRLALSNLARLQCIKLVPTFGEEVFNVVHPSLFGEKLYDAVTIIPNNDT